jgi:GTP cyclohydrolase FolE2
MGRFVQILSRYHSEIDLHKVGAILRDMRKELEADSAHLEMEFPYFLVKKAPVSGMESVMDYTARFDANANGQEIDFVLTVKANVTTLCPCSKAISAHGAHNQRGTVTVNQLLATNFANSVVSFNGGTLNSGGSTINNSALFRVGNGLSNATLQSSQVQLVLLLLFPRKVIWR